MEELSSSPSTASTSQEDHESISGSTSSRKLRVTLLSSEWRSTKGGLSTINRELAIQLAKHPNVEVSVYLPQCSEEDKQVAASHNVQLIEVEEMPGYDPVDWLSFLPENHAVDCVIGHGAVLGRQVQILKRIHHCKWIQVVHTAPEELGMYKSYADAISRGEKKHQAEVKLCEKADQVVAVGPKLAEAFSGYLRACGKDQDILNLTPGIFSEFSDVKQATEERKTFSVLVFGRGDNEDFQLKGYDIAARAIAELKDEPQPYKLLFVGAPSGEEEKVKDLLLQQGIDRSQLTVRCFNESREQLARLFCEVGLAMMPSRTEGFGLAALEALSAGLPVLVSGNSGLGEALQEVPNGSNCVVESEDPKDWANAIKAVRKKKRKLRLKEAKLLQGQYGETYSWQDHCNRLVQRMLAISQGSIADEQNLSKKATVICHDEKPSPSEKRLHKGSKKGKRPLSPSSTPASKVPKCLGDEGPNADEQNLSKKATVICQDEKPFSSEKRLHKGSAKKRQSSKKGKRPLSSSNNPAPKYSRPLEDEGRNSLVLVKLLKKEYTRRSRLRPLLWDSTIQLPIEQVYTRLKIVSRGKLSIQMGDDEVNLFDIHPYYTRLDFVARGKLAIPMEDDEEEIDDVNVFDIFKVPDIGEDVMTIVEGSPGIGKTTFCLKLAYDWAHGNIPSECSFPKFEFVFLLKCRDINGDIMEAISEQLLPRGMEKSVEKLLHFMKDIHKQERLMLIILDGLDELPEQSRHHVDELLHRRIFPFCFVLATTRQERGIEVRKSVVFDIHLEIKGYTESDSIAYIRRHFETIKQSPKGEKLIEEMQQNTFLHALRNNPLNLLLLCVVYEDYKGKLPTSRTELYQVIVRCLLRRYCSKRNWPAPKDDSVLEKTFEKEILALGELAWICLLSDRYGFFETELDEFERKYPGLKARELDLLYMEESLKRLNPKHEYCFLHKTFQEYVAAAYIAEKLVNQQFNVFEYMTFYDLVTKYPQVFIFVSGMLGGKATVLFTQIGEELKKTDWNWNKHCNEVEASFFIESFNESGHPEHMAVTLCNIIPFPKVITLESDEDYNASFVQVLMACKNFSNLQTPVELYADTCDWDRDERDVEADVVESYPQLTTTPVELYADTCDWDRDERDVEADVVESCPQLSTDLTSFPSTASTSREHHESNSGSTSSRKLRVTLLSSEWRSTKGGLSTINRELTIQLAKHPSVEVSVYLPQCSEEDKRVAARHGVTLIEAREMPGLEPDLWLSCLPEDHAVDFVIGHGAVLGWQVQFLKRIHHFKWIQVVHTAPEELGMYKSYEDAISRGEKKHQAEVKLCEKADQVVAIGPKLAEAFSGYLRACGKDQDVLNLTPGIFSEFSDVKQATDERKTFSVLLFGRGANEDFQLKGYNIASRAIAELKDEPQPYKLLFVGAPSGEEEKVKDLLLQQGIGHSQLTVRCFNESREQLARLFCEVDLAIMPSRTEGFGLAALEALSAGLPVLVSGNSGLGEALKEVPYGSCCVVESKDPKDWADAIKAVRKKKRKLRLREAKLLQGEYAAMYSWLDHCNRLVERMLAISQDPTADEQNLSKKATVIFEDVKPSSSEKRRHKGSSEGVQPVKKGKRPLPPSGDPDPKQPRLPRDEDVLQLDKLSIVPEPSVKSAYEGESVEGPKDDNYKDPGEVPMATASGMRDIRAATMMFEAKHEECIRVLPYIKDGQIVVQFYVYSGESGIPKDLEEDAQQSFKEMNVKLEWSDLCNNSVNVLKVQRLEYSSEKPKTLTASQVDEMNDVIEKNLPELSKHRNITSVQASFKIKNSTQTDEPCITLYVLGKGFFPIGERKFPNALGDYPVDVVNGFWTRAGSSTYWEPNSAQKPRKTLCSGLSIGIQGDEGAGTLGAIVKNGITFYALSCHHVMASEQSERIVHPALFDHLNYLRYYLAQYRRVVNDETGLETQGSVNDLTTREALVKSFEELKSRKDRHAQGYSRERLKLIKKAENDFKRGQKQPREIGKRVVGVSDNFEWTADGKKYFIDAAIAELFDREVKRLKGTTARLIGNDGKPRGCSPVGKRETICKNRLCKSGRTTVYTEIKNRILGDEKNVQTPHFMFDSPSYHLDLPFISTDSKEFACERCGETILKFIDSTEPLTCDNCSEKEATFRTNHWYHRVLCISEGKERFADDGDSGAVIFEIDQTEGDEKFLSGLGLFFGIGVTQHHRLVFASPLKIVLDALTDKLPPDSNLELVSKF